MRLMLEIGADGSAAVTGIERVEGAIEDLGGATERSTRQAERGVSGLESGIKRLVLAAGAFVGGGALVAGFKAVLNDSAAVQTNLLRTEALLLATGNAAGFSAQQLRDQARDTAYATLQSTDALERAQQVMLTFKSITGETFERAMSLAADTATVFGGLESATVQISKALEAPVAGMGALAEVGVTFSESQQAVIKSLMASGDQLGAQSLILDVLAGQLGGVAEAEAAGFAGAQDSLAQATQEAVQALADQAGIVEGSTGAYNAITEQLWVLVDALGYDVPTGAKSATEATGWVADGMRWLGESISGIPVMLAGMREDWAVWGDTASEAFGLVAASLGWLLAEIDAGASAVTDLIPGIESQGSAWEGLLQIIELVGDAFFDLPTNLAAAVQIILAEVDVLAAGFEAGMQSLGPITESAWLWVANAVRAAMQGIKQAVADGVAFVAAKLASLARDMAGFAASIPAILDLGGVAAASAMGLQEMAAGLDQAGAAAAGLRAEGEQASQQYARRQGELSAELKAIEATGKAAAAAARERGESVAADAKASSEARQARAAEAKATESARIETEKLARQTRDTTVASGAATAGAQALAGALAGGGGGKGRSGGVSAAAREAAEATRELERAQQQALSATDSLIKRYLPARAASEEFAEAQAALAVAMEKGKVTQAEATEILAGLTEEQAKAAQRAAGDADAWGELWENAVKRVDDAFADMWVSLIDGTASTLDTLRTGIKRWLAEVAHALLTKPLVVAITASASGTATAQAGSAASTGLGGAQSVSYLSKISGMLSSNSIGEGVASALGRTFGQIGAIGESGWFNQGLSNLAGTSNLTLGASTLGGGLAGGLVASQMFEGEYVSIGSTIGSAVGSVAAPMIAAAIGMGPIGWAGLAAGAFIGALGGGGLGSLFGGKREDPRINLGVESGSFKINSTNRWGQVDGGDGATARAIEQLNAEMWALAESLGPGAEAAMAAFRHAGQELSSENFEQWIADVSAGMVRAMAQGVRDDALVSAGSGLLAGIMTDALADAGDDPRAMLAAVEAARAIERNLYAAVEGIFNTVGSAVFDTGDLTLVATRIYQLAHATMEAGEGIDVAMSRVTAGVDAGVTALKLSGDAAAGMSVQAIYEIGEALAEAAGGYDAAASSMASYYDLFFSEEEKRADAIEAAQRATSRALDELDLSMPSSEAEFKALIASLDLTTESGLEAFAALTGLSEAFKLLFDAMKDGGSAIDALLGTRTALRDAADRLSPDTAPVDRKGAEDALAAAGYSGDFNSAAIAEFLRALAQTEDAGGAAGKALLEMIDVLARAAAEADRIAEERKSLETRLLELSGTDAEILAAKRAAEMAAVDESNRGILRRIYLLEDEAKAREAAAKIKAETDDLTMRYLEALGNDARLIEAKRKKELEETDPVNRALLEAIWALEDAARAKAAEQQRIDELSSGLADIFKDILDNAKDTADAQAKAAAAFESFIRDKLMNQMIDYISDQFSRAIIDSYLGPLIEGIFGPKLFQPLLDSIMQGALLEQATATTTAAMQINGAMMASSIQANGGLMAGTMLSQGGLIAGTMMTQGGMTAGLAMAQGGLMAAGAIAGVVKNIIDAIGKMIDIFNDPAFKDAFKKLADAFGKLGGALFDAFGKDKIDPPAARGTSGGGGGGAVSAAADSALEEIAGLLDSIRSVLDDRMPTTEDAQRASYAAARRQLDLWVASGVIPDRDGFDRVVDALNADATSRYATKEDYIRQYWATSSALMALERNVAAQDVSLAEPTWAPAGDWTRSGSAGSSEQSEAMAEQNRLLKRLLEEQTAANAAIAASTARTARRLDRIARVDGSLAGAA